MAAHQVVLRRVGWTLLVVGVLDIAFMAYCIANSLSYSSSLNIFAVIGGAYLMRGNLSAARVVTWFSAFYLSAFLLALVVVFPWLQPFDYWRTAFVRSPSELFVSGLTVVVVLGVIAWVYSQLRSPVVIQARVAAGHARQAPISAFLAGGFLVLILAAASYVMLHGDAAEKAVRLAAEQHGAEYRYFVSGMNWSGGHVRASLVAYNERETKDIEVEWDE
jgi:hypothetical protein